MLEEIGRGFPLQQVFRCGHYVSFLAAGGT
jgi:hypothetical protein